MSEAYETLRKQALYHERFAEKQRKELLRLRSEGLADVVGSAYLDYLDQAVNAHRDCATSLRQRIDRSLQGYVYPRHKEPHV